jgi:four helix bundle protein
MSKPVNSYRDLIVWQKSINLTVIIYELTEKLPRYELYGLVSQMRRAAVSISSNIAEGYRRRSRKEFRRFLEIAFGSGAELETQLVIVKQLPLGKGLDFKNTDSLLDEVMKMLNSMIRNLSRAHS